MPHDARLRNAVKEAKVFMPFQVFGGRQCCTVILSMVKKSGALQGTAQLVDHRIEIILCVAGDEQNQIGLVPHSANLPLPWTTEFVPSLVTKLSRALGEIFLKRLIGKILGEES